MPDNDITPQTIKVQLSRPIKVGGVEVDEITVHEPKVRHLSMLDPLRLGGDESGNVALTNMGSVMQIGIEQLCGLTPGEAAELSVPDAMKIGKVVLDFFGFAPLDLGAIKSGL
ncbi:MAG: phage tail assembly protein [Deltaproteobacteria bacterium]|nr:phage tail assembly protein [Deltaproteobacteria bacterium]